MWSADSPLRICSDISSNSVPLESYINSTWPSNHHNNGDGMISMKLLPFRSWDLEQSRIRDESEDPKDLIDNQHTRHSFPSTKTFPTTWFDRLVWSFSNYHTMEHMLVVPEARLWCRWNGSRPSWSQHIPSPIHINQHVKGLVLLGGFKNYINSPNTPI